MKRKLYLYIQLAAYIPRRLLENSGSRFVNNKSELSSLLWLGLRLLLLLLLLLL